MLPRPLKEQLVAAIRRLLRPIVRQLVAWGVTYPMLDELIRSLYVEVAEQEFALPFKRQTTSRLSLVTGLHRKEIARLRRLPPASRSLPAVEETIVTRVIGRWMAGPPYADRRGRARVLPYESARPGQASFARLVRERAIDVPVRSVLDEMLRLGIAELRPTGEVVLLKEAHIPAEGAEGKLTLLGSDPAELFSTIVHNIEHAEAPRLQRKVAYDHVGSEALPEIREEARRAGEEFIRHANALLAARDRDRNPEAPGGERTRVVLGAYYFEEPAAGASRAAAPDATATAAARRPANPPGRITRSR